MNIDQGELQLFLEFSSTVTGFNRFRLHGTGQAEAHLSAVTSVVGNETLSELLKRYRQAIDQAGNDDARDSLMRALIFSDEKYGPVARNIIKLWYVGTWYQLPSAWHDTYGARERDTTFVVSPSAYTEGLLWPAIGANPPGAKGPGYGTWAEPPRIPDAE